MIYGFFLHWGINVSKCMLSYSYLAKNMYQIGFCSCVCIRAMIFTRYEWGAQMDINTIILKRYILINKWFLNSSIYGWRFSEPISVPCPRPVRPTLFVCARSGYRNVSCFEIDFGRIFVQTNKWYGQMVQCVDVRWSVSVSVNVPVFMTQLNNNKRSAKHIILYDHRVYIVLWHKLMRCHFRLPMLKWRTTGIYILGICWKWNFQRTNLMIFGVDAVYIIDGQHKSRIYILNQSSNGTNYDVSNRG